MATQIISKSLGKEYIQWPNAHFGIEIIKEYVESDDGYNIALVVDSVNAGDTSLETRVNNVKSSDLRKFRRNVHRSGKGTSKNRA